MIIGEGNNLATIRTGYAIAATLGFWLPVITLALFGLGILIARRRSTAVLGTGIGFAIGGGTLALDPRRSARPPWASPPAISTCPPTRSNVIYEQLVGTMTQTALVLTLLGVFVAVLGWLMGGSRPARGFARAIDGLNASARRQLAERGLDTGAFGAWLGRQRMLVRDVIAVLAVLWLFALRPLSVATSSSCSSSRFGVAWILELLQRRPEELDAVGEAEDDLLVQRRRPIDARRRLRRRDPPGRRVADPSI